MPPILELQRDKSFRLKLMLVCLSVALSVATIYVVVSYRLAADLGLKTELDSLHRQAMFLHGEILLSKNDSQQHLSELVSLVYFSKHFSVPQLYIKVSNSDMKWSMNHNIDKEKIDYLISKLPVYPIITSHIADMPNGVTEVDDVTLLWQVIQDDRYQITIVKTSQSLDDTLKFVMQRLIITSVIVFWLAAWLALTLSSWMNKRVQNKNDALARLATHDALTGLPNRLYLTNLMQSIDLCPTSIDKKSDYHNMPAPKQGSLFVIDLDKFKEVNDTFGHAAGDSLLIDVAQKLQNALNNTQTLVRLGGDEFIVWAPEMDITDAKDLAQRLIEVCNEPVMINKLSINTGASIGISHYPSHTNNAESLITLADVAMYEAKQKRSGWSLFSERNTQRGHQRLRLRADLENALTDNQIKLHYQPKVSLADGQIIGVEGLARWYHPTDGLLSPYHFIDLIEQSGRVQEFGRYIILNAIEQLSQWQKQGIYTPIAINLSPYNLLDPELLDYTFTLLEKYAINSSYLEIELIESSTSINIDYISCRLSDFKQAGIKLAIDDFGTGMSSLSYISNLNVNHIKIDRSFIIDIEQDVKKQAVAALAISLAKTFDSKAIAEGVENKAQADLLIEMGCLYGQGYYFAKPMPVEEIEPLLLNNVFLPIS
ncbi:EAL domain-containing protein [Marinomonas pontica]|uniref:putative bifunctional diguanylate cyclase/phosphodiesterase n=1 Tax=Marinomonas pontica TaxID=264739 RepID=UPI002243FA65|nr:EAL domain-containing protein [Marinomonas pontica]MCW8354527.1 EAL domain-containing protein [Marinomonas pontica]